MTAAATSQPKRVTIETPGQLLEALSSPQPEQRAAIIRAIAAAPAKALQVGREEGFDLVGELLRLYQECRDELRAGYLYALLVFPDPRCLAVANLLADCLELSPAVALRVALLSDHEVVPPPVAPESLPAWLSELEGPYPVRTRKKLVQGSGENLTELLECWGQLTRPVRRWALDAATRENPGRWAELIRRLVAEGADQDILPVALDALRRLPSVETDRMTVAALFSHDDPAVRAAAVRAGSLNENWAGLLVEEASPQVRIALLERLGEHGQGTDLAAIAGELEASDWRVRAAAVEVLAEAGPAAMPFLRMRASHPEPAVRAAAARAMAHLGVASNDLFDPD